MTSFRERCAHAIDTSWHHSWHWPERDWELTALKQARERREKVIQQLTDLQGVIKELELWEEQ